MQNTKWLRIGFFAMLAMAGSVTAIACGGDDDDDANTSSSGGADGGSSSGSSSGGSSGASSSSGGSSGASSGGSSSGGPATAALVVVHGAISDAIGPVKICFSASPTAMPADGATPQPLSPLPETPSGLLEGSAGILPRLGAPLAQLNILPYLVKVSSLSKPENENKDCDELIGAGKPLVKDTDYFTLEGIPAGTLQDEKTYILVAREGETPGTVRRELIVPDLADVDAAKIGVQFVHASDYITGLGATSDVAPFLDRADGEADAGADGGDAGGPPAGRTFEYILGADNTTKVNPFAPISALKVTEPFNTPLTTAIGIQVGALNTTLLNTTGLGGSGTLVPVAQWAAVSDPFKTQGDGDASLYFKAGNAFTFLLVGSTTAPPPAGDPNSDAYKVAALKRPHFIVFPNKPIVPAPAP